MAATVAWQEPATVRWVDRGSFPDPVAGDDYFIVTEAGDFLVTEAGDFLVWM